MSFAWAYYAVTAIGAAATVYSADRSRTATNTANDQAIKQAKDTAAAADRANNAANAKTPDVAAMLAANLAAGKSGAAGTMLTGPGGIDPTQLTLGKSSLLGG